MKDDSCANALDCYMRLRKSLRKDGTEKYNRRLLEHEVNGNVLLLGNCTFQTACTSIVFFSEKITQYEFLCNNPNYSHIVHLDRTTPLIEMKRIDGTNKMAQVQIVIGSNARKKWSFSTVYPPWLCPIYLSTSSNDNCMYKDTRKVETQIVSDSIVDLEGIDKFIVDVLQEDSAETSLPYYGKKKELVLQMMMIYSRRW